MEAAIQKQELPDEHDDDEPVESARAKPREQAADPDVTAAHPVDKAAGHKDKTRPESRHGKPGEVRKVTIIALVIGVIVLGIGAIVGYAAGFFGFAVDPNNVLAAIAAGMVLLTSIAHFLSSGGRHVDDSTVRVLDLAGSCLTALALVLIAAKP